MTMWRRLAACAAPLVLLCIITCLPSLAQSPRSETDLSGQGWKLWLDKSAQWEKDRLYLPPVDVKSLPVNPPTGGWQMSILGEGRIKCLRARHGGGVLLG